MRTIFETILYHDYDRKYGYQSNALSLHQILCAWKKQASRLKSGEITREEYDKWRCSYPELAAFRMGEKTE